MNTEKIRGIYPVLYAFFDESGGLDRGAMRRQADFCVESGVHGVMVLGLGTEVYKLDLRERRLLLDWAAEDLGGRLPLAVTVSEPNVAAQIAFVRAAAEAGADWAILQPPPVRNMPESEYIRFFGDVADGSELPLAIQNAPDYIGIGLSNQGLADLHRNHPNVVAVKAECAALGVARLVEQTEGVFRILNGRGGMELTDNLRAGCVGMIPGFETSDVQARIFDLMVSERQEDEERADDPVPGSPAPAGIPHAVAGYADVLRQAARGSAARARRRARPRPGDAPDASRARAPRPPCGAASGSLRQERRRPRQLTRPRAPRAAPRTGPRACRGRAGCPGGRVSGS